MNAYFLSLLGGAFLAAAVGMLAPGGSSSGLGKHLRLVSVLVLFCLLAAPLPELIAGWKSISDPGATTEQFDFSSRAQETLDAASRSYFARALTTHLEEKFGIASGELRCAIVWEEADLSAKPASVTLIFSGSAKWKNPHEAEAYVSELLSCPCDSAIE